MGLLFIDGNQAVAMGALYAGCRFFSAYPITPASSLFAAMLEQLPAAGGIVLQGEDEIAAIGYLPGSIHGRPEGYDRDFGARHQPVQ